MSNLPTILFLKFLGSKTYSICNYKSVICNELLSFKKSLNMYTKAVHFSKNKSCNESPRRFIIHKVLYS